MAFYAAIAGCFVGLFSLLAIPRVIAMLVARFREKHQQRRDRQSQRENRTRLTPTTGLIGLLDMAKKFGSLYYRRGPALRSFLCGYLYTTLEHYPSNASANARRSEINITTAISLVQVCFDQEIVKEHGQKAATNSFYTPAAPVTGPTGDDQGETVNEVPFRLQTYP
ncbi:hypothetical protein TRIATDRAFT_86908 [Trichoderma atroviride IMI 206040]|uniref:Uncharacterized protein n=1 Tax=Hypocrea atroviridis (strain ATCC 20476 / IMI 206040) TaxID=452589 RepID=G9NZA4_HYPAI|nr:uncharacterized protein TRIATDRAFT_86908 [Trichoderma atroviride IMI 206040]EHK43814.1 hypothetical protein TRIATDRAFT_86908 [Trichoderma atroviride IMI 206040]